jgi:hypothetical protein
MPDDVSAAFGGILARDDVAAAFVERDYLGVVLWRVENATIQTLQVTPSAASRRIRGVQWRARAYATHASDEGVQAATGLCALDLRMQDLLAIKALPPLSERRSRRKTKSSLVQTPLSPAAWLALFGYMQRHEINQLEIRPLGGRLHPVGATPRPSRRVCFV